MQIQFIDVAEIFPMGLFADLGAAPKVEPEIPNNERERVMAERDALSDMLNDAIEIIERERLENFNTLLDIARHVDRASCQSQAQGRALEQYRNGPWRARPAPTSFGTPSLPRVRSCVT